VTVDEFAGFFERWIDRARQVAVVKGREYSRNNDRLSNFKKQAGLDQGSLESAAWGNIKKHLASVSDLITDVEAGIEADSKVWLEKLGDLQVYVTLLAAIRHEKAPLL